MTLSPRASACPLPLRRPPPPPPRHAVPRRLNRRRKKNADAPPVHIRAVSFRSDFFFSHTFPVACVCRATARRRRRRRRWRAARERRRFPRSLRRSISRFVSPRCAPDPYAARATVCSAPVAARRWGAARRTPHFCIYHAKSFATVISNSLTAHASTLRRRSLTTLTTTRQRHFTARPGKSSPIFLSHKYYYLLSSLLTEFESDCYFFEHFFSPFSLILRICSRKRIL